MIIERQKTRKGLIIFFFSLFVTVVFLFFLPLHPAYAISKVKNIGTNSLKSAGTQIQVSVPVGGVAPGNSIIVTFAMDVLAGAVSCVDTAGNTYTVDVDVTSAGNVRTVILSAHNVLALSAGNTITVLHPSVTARAMAVTEFTGVGKTYTCDKTKSAIGTGNPMSSGLTSTTAYANELLIGGIGVEGPNGDTFTQGTGWSVDVTRAGTALGGGATNITINQEYWIVSAHGTYQADGSNSVSRDWAAAIATYREGCTEQFSYRREIKILDGQVMGTSNFSDFPVLIKLPIPPDPGDWLKTKYAAPATGRIENLDGSDIIFRASDGTTTLKHQIEKYDGSAGTLLAWVRVPTLYAQQDTFIYIYYGNRCVPPNTQDVNGVWSTSYRGVWHLTEDNTGTGTVDLYKDSTQNANHGDDYVSATGKEGQIYNGQQFSSATSDYIGIADSLSFNLSADFTVSAWIKPTTAWGDIGDQYIHNIFGDDTATTGTFAFRLGGNNLQANQDKIGLAICESGSFHDFVSNTSLSLGSWQYVAVTYDGSNVRFYRNGEPDGSPSASYIPDNPPNPWFIGKSGDGAPIGPRHFAGYIDEVRVSNPVHSEDWIKTEYNNQSSPYTFYTLGGESSPAPAPTAVTLETFTATCYGNQVYVEWRTGYEVDNLGFHVYREENGQLYRLTPEFIAGSALFAGSGTALTAGRHYVWWDTSVSNQLSALSHPLPNPPPRGGGAGWGVQYWLEDIDLNGKRTMYGPVTPVISQEPLPEKAKPAKFLSELGTKLNEQYRDYWRIQELKEKLGKKPVTKLQPSVQSFGDEEEMGVKASYEVEQASGQNKEMQWFLTSRPAVKILVKEEGWYRVTQPELVAAGLNPGTNPRYLQLFVNGREHPIRVIGEKDGRFDPQDAIEFYGVGLDTLSTDTHVYWLIAGTRPGKRIHERHGRGGSLARSLFPYTVEKKDRTIYSAALRNGEKGNFFGSVIATEPVEQLITIQHLASSVRRNAILEVALQGLTNVPHRVKVLFNNAEVKEVVFNGQSHRFVRLPISQSLLLEGENLVTLIAQGGKIDISLVDYIRLTYWHTYTADSDALKFTAQGGRRVSLDGFSSPHIRVIDITNPRALIEIAGEVKPQEAGYSMTFRVPGEDRRTLLAFTDEKIKNPSEIIANQPSSWYQERNGYDFVIISHKDFIQSLLPLKGLRESQGLSVALIDVEELYDEFNFGAKSPQALKDFLLRAKAVWRKPPRFILLVGDASFDPRNYLGLGDFDFVPTKLIDTSYLETASDDWFADRNRDTIPEMAVGRLPVRTAEEATMVVSKIIGYEQAGGMSEALLIADRNDVFDFEAASNEVGELFPLNIGTRKIYRNTFGSDELAKGEILSSIDQGPLLVNYIGHGSVEVWRGSILTSDDAEGLVNGQRLPFFVSMTCLNGFFHDLYTESLAEALLKAKQGGAVAVWSSSGLTEPAGQAVMDKELIRLLFSGESLTIGEATAKAKASVRDKDIRRTWILFGDPTMRLKSN